MKKIFLAVVLFMFCVSCLWAQETEETDAKGQYDIGNVVVTATKTEERIEEVGSSFTVITSQDIAKTGKDMVADVLRDVPGVTVVQSGSMGSLADVYLRGVSPGQTLVLIDGVEVNDPMAPTRGFDFAHITVEDIDRIEVIRGPQSTLYGSDAMGGVINIITKKGEGKPSVSVGMEAGSYMTFRESAGLSGGTEKVDYAASVTRIDTDGFSSAKGGTEDDGYYNTTLSGRVGANVLETARVSGIVRYTDAKTDLDDGSFEDDPNYYSKWKEFVSRAEFDQQLFPWWDHNLSLSYTDTKRNYYDKDDNLIYYLGDMKSWYKGEIIETEWQHNFYIKEIDTITAGAEYQWERGSSFYKSGGLISDFPKKKMDDWAVYLQNILKLWEKLFITAGIRRDDNDEFGADTNYRAAVSYLHEQTNTQIKGSYGTGLKAPTLFQLYSIYGDTGLSAEESRGYDIGFVQKLFNEKISVGVTYFYNKLKDLIDWNPADSRYANIGRVVTKGVESEIFFYPIEVLGIGINYTYLETEDKDTGLSLLRRPKNKVSLNINWKFCEKGNFDVNMRYVGKRDDIDFTTFERTDLGSYFVVDLYCSYDINDDCRIYGRAVNILNENYEEVYGFNTPGRSGYAGLKIKM